ncbi:SAG family member [Eimeria mitis]|uniref:SAG family member n=1 Tax=Eimeria mitis TaxID=44415 RepID=U6K0A2_9EIME|nr:SAG family member [Eimeria mitis]CDJ29193.1 SAG family member [Eimeria mitis]
MLEPLPLHQHDPDGWDSFACWTEVTLTYTSWRVASSSSFQAFNFGLVHEDGSTLAPVACGCRRARCHGGARREHEQELGHPLELGTTEQEQLPILGSESALDTEYVEKVCTAMKADKAPSEKAATLTAYTENTAPYDKVQNVSFISLFNPKENAKVDCAYFICPAAEEDADEPKNRNDDEPPSEDPEPEATTDKDLKAILCITTPSALEANKAPYEQAQWDRISAAVNSSNGSAAAPTLLLLAAAVLGAYFF